jgi:3-keto-5-aminohexanoate cleavage enzyme
MNTVRWDRVERELERENHRMIWRPYGLPGITNPVQSAFIDAVQQPPWPMPERLIVSAAITGAFFGTDDNPSQPVTPDDIRSQARTSALAGASTVHIHVRDDRGYNTLSHERFSSVIAPLREELPDLAVDGCLVAALPGEWAQMRRMLDSHLLDAVPINVTATYVGDALFAKPIPVVLEKTRLVLEAGAIPIVACYTDGDVANADRLLFRSGLLSSPSYWIILPALPGCSPMENPRQMVEGLMRMASAIRDVDADAVILVCAAGRASTYLVTVAAALGLHIRVGMEDTVWRWPHREDLVDSNLTMVESATTLARLLGREVATHAEYRAMVGMSRSAAVRAS